METVQIKKTELSPVYNRGKAASIQTLSEHWAYAV